MKPTTLQALAATGLGLAALAGPVCRTTPEPPEPVRSGAETTRARRPTAAAAWS